MANKNIPIGVNIPNYCQQVGGDKLVCVENGKREECEFIKSDELLCGPHKDKQCLLLGGNLECYGEVNKHIAVTPNAEVDMQTVFIGHAYLVVIAAILSLAITQIIKPFIWKTCKEKADAVIRLVAVLTGASIAFTLSKPFMMIDVYMGASAGAINAFVIKMFKAKVKKSLGVDETPEPSKKEEDNE